MVFDQVHHPFQQERNHRSHHFLKRHVLIQTMRGSDTNNIGSDNFQEDTKGCNFAFHEGPRFQHDEQQALKIFVYYSLKPMIIIESKRYKFQTSKI